MEHNEAAIHVSSMHVQPDLTGSDADVDVDLEAGRRGGEG